MLIPTYNYARYLPETIESVLAQDGADFEVLISDDASTDESAAVIAAYAKADGRIRPACHRENLGMVANWNWCLRQARGDYIKFVFGDDALATPHALSRLARRLDENPAAPLAASARLLLDGESRVTGVWNELAGGEHPGIEVIARCLRTRRNLIGEPSTVMFRRRAARRGFDPAYRQIVDLELWFHLLLDGPLVYEPEPLCAFRRHERQQTAVNHRSAAPHLETVRLMESYLARPEVAANLPPGGLRCRWLVFRHLYFTRKAAGNLPEVAAETARLRRRLLRRWGLLFWLWHRLTRPVENAWRKLGAWRLRGRCQRVETTWPTFLETLPSAVVRRRDGGKAAGGSAAGLLEKRD